MQRCSDTSQEHHFYGPEWTNPTWSHAVTIHPPFASSLLATLVSLGISGKFWPCRSKKHSRPGHVAWLGPSGVREGSLKPRSLLGGTPAKAEGGGASGRRGKSDSAEGKNYPLASHGCWTQGQCCSLGVGLTRFYQRDPHPFREGTSLLRLPFQGWIGIWLPVFRWAENI